jgi:hypothetical protein
MKKCKLSPFAFGMSLGLVWGLSVFVTGLMAYYLSYGKPFVMAMSAMYIGYEPSVMGSLIGGAFGFVDGLIGGALIALFYNGFSQACGCCQPCPCCDGESKKISCCDSEMDATQTATKSKKPAVKRAPQKKAPKKEA